MTVVGLVNVDRPSGWEAGNGAVATLHSYGPRGGTIGTVYVDRRNAQEIANRLDVIAGVRSKATPPPKADDPDSRAMDAIHALLNGSEWSADTAPAVAEIVRSTGRPIIDPDDVASRLEVLRGELRAERISYRELAELQSLADHIEPGDVELLEAAGVPEFPETER